LRFQEHLLFFGHAVFAREESG